MQTFYLLLSRACGGFSPTNVVCASAENTDRMTGICLTFSSISELETALNAAGFSEFAPTQAFGVVRSGYATFLPVTEEVALRLGFLKEQ